MATSPANSTSTQNPAARRTFTNGTNVGFSILGAGLLALAAVEAGLLVRPEPHTASASRPAGQSTELTMPVSAMSSHYPLGFAPPPERGGNVISIATDTNTLGTTLYRLWGSGRVEASVLGESNTWTEWAPVAPGLTGIAPPLKKKGE